MMEPPSAGPRVLLGSLAVLALIALPLVCAEQGDCLVRDTHVVKEIPANATILSYLTITDNLTVMVEFENTDFLQTRDTVILTNVEGKHYSVRGINSNATTHSLPSVLPEGWSMLMLTAAARSLTVTLLMKGADQETLLTLPINYTIHSLRLEGSISPCLTDSPRWRVSEGREAKVLLQPRRPGHGGQHLLLWAPGDGGGQAYITFPDSQNKVSIPTNTSITISTRRRHSHTHIEVFQDTTEEEKLANWTQVVTRPLVLMVGSRGGLLYICMNLSSILPYTDPPVCPSLGFFRLGVQPYSMFIIAVIVVTAMVVQSSLLAVCRKAVHAWHFLQWLLRPCQPNTPAAPVTENDIMIPGAEDS